MGVSVCMYVRVYGARVCVLVGVYSELGAKLHV